MDVGEGSSMYNINPPSVPVERPHKPKLRKLQIEALNRYINFGTSFSQTNASTKDSYIAFKNEQKNNESLKSLGVFDKVVEWLDGDVGYDSFVEKMWSCKASEGQDRDANSFLKVVKYTLTTFHLVCKSSPMYISNHERTHFVENVIPSLLALGKMLEFVEFKWYIKKA